MRRQNPPQAYIDKAQDIERYLGPGALAAMYAIASAVFCAIILLVFAGLTYASIIDPTPDVRGIFAVIAEAPVVALSLVWCLRPDDPVSARLSRLANSWRNPIDLIPEICTFTILLADGELVGVRLAFYYSPENHTKFLKELLYTCVYTSLANAFSGHTIAPTDQEIERAIDPAMDILALEYDVSIFYAEVLEISSDRSEVMPSVHYLKTELLEREAPTAPPVKSHNPTTLPRSRPTPLPSCRVKTQVNYGEHIASAKTAEPSGG